MWLNEYFYNSAFTLGNEYIQTTTVDNKSTSNMYACDDTEDKVFLPSNKDYNNSSYGFPTSTPRCCKTTDWARARGASYSTKSSNLYNGVYWTRSPASNYKFLVVHIGSGGGFFTSGGYIYNEDFCVRPALTLRIA